MTAVVLDGDVYRVKLAVPVADAGNVPSGLNLGFVEITGQSNWGRALCSINLDTETLPVDYGSGPRVTSVSPSSGPQEGGTTVFIWGMNFATCYVGGNGSTLLIVSAPGGTAGDTVDVTVTTQNGTSPLNRPADQYKYADGGPAPAVPGPAGLVFPQLTGLNPSNGPAAGTNQIQIFGSGLSNASGVKFGNTPGSIPHSPLDNDGQLTVIAPPETGTVDVRVATPVGISGINPHADLYAYDSAPVASGPPLDCPTRLANLSSAYAAWDNAIKVNLGASYIQLCYETVLAAQTAAQPCLVEIALQNSPFVKG